MGNIITPIKSPTKNEPFEMAKESETSSGEEEEEESEEEITSSP
jgi:hypothetical protein